MHNISRGGIESRPHGVVSQHTTYNTTAMSLRKQQVIRYRTTLNHPVVNYYLSFESSATELTAHRGLTAHVVIAVTIDSDRTNVYTVHHSSRRRPNVRTIRSVKYPVVWWNYINWIYVNRLSQTPLNILGWRDHFFGFCKQHNRIYSLVP